MNDDRVLTDTPTETDDLTALHSTLAHYARQLWDVQKQRVALGNRIGAMERDGVGHRAEHLRETLKAYEGIERDIDRWLVMDVKKHPMADWIAAQRGIGLPGFARLLGVTGNIDRFPTVSKLWKYLGLHVVDGHAPKREKGVPWTHTHCQGGHLLTCKPDCATDHHPNCTPDGIGTAYAPQGRVVCHQLGEAIVKVGGDGPYRRAYDERKALYESERQDWTQAHRHNAAMRFAVKLLVKNLWVEWHRRRGNVDAYDDKIETRSDPGVRQHPGSDTGGKSDADSVYLSDVPNGDGGRATVDIQSPYAAIPADIREPALA